MEITLNGHYQVLTKLQQFSTRRIAMIALLSSLAYIGRLLCQPLPNIQPVTVIIVLITVYMGWIDGVCVAVISIVLSNMLMGMGPWTMAQILTYVILVAITWLFTHKFLKTSESTHKGMTWIMVALVGFLGLLYGFIISLFSYKLFGLAHFWPYYIQGLAFDIMHAVGNSVFYLLLTPLLKPLMQKFVNQDTYR